MDLNERGESKERGGVFFFFMFTLEMWCGTGGLIPALTLISDINNRTAIIIKFQKGGSEIATGKHHDPAQTSFQSWRFGAQGLGSFFTAHCNGRLELV